MQLHIQNVAEYVFKASTSASSENKHAWWGGLAGGWMDGRIQGIDVWQMTEVFQADRESLWPKISIRYPGRDTSATAANATAASLRSQTSTSSAKNKDPLFPFFPEQHNPEVSGRQIWGMAEQIVENKIMCGWEICFGHFCSFWSFRVFFLESNMQF